MIVPRGRQSEMCEWMDGEVCSVLHRLTYCDTSLNASNGQFNVVRILPASQSHAGSASSLVGEVYLPYSMDG